MSERMFANIESKEKVLNKCPICGCELEYVELCQYSNIYKILKNGTISKTRKCKRDDGFMECGFISCSDPGCSFHTDCDYDVDETGKYNRIYIYENNKGQFMIDVD